MSVYTDRKEFFKMLSTIHYQVKYNQVIPDSEGMKRKSFMVIDNAEELPAAMMNQIHFPCVAHVDFSGKPVDKNGSIRVKNNNELLFLDKPLTTALNVTTTSANDAAFDRSFAVMMDFISWMYEKYEETGNCGPFKNIDLNLFNWRKQDYIQDGCVGWILTFSDEVSAADIIVYDAGKWNEGLITEEGDNIQTEDEENINVE
jgi:hypothetical protein